MKTKIAAGVVIMAAWGTTYGMTAHPAEAGSLTNTSTSTNVLVSPKCYHHHGTSATQFHWDSKAGRYVAYSGTHHSTTDYTTCHK